MSVDDDERTRRANVEIQLLIDFGVFHRLGNEWLPQPSLLAELHAMASFASGTYRNFINEWTRVWRRAAK